MSKTGFKDRTGPKKIDPPHSPKDGKPVPQGWDFRAPEYDQRSSCFLNTGTHYGTGHRQPVGHHGDGELHADCLPFGKVNTLRTYEEK